MSLINDPVLNMAEAIRNNFKTDAQTTFKRAVQKYETGLQDFWKNKRATPQQISAALGTEAADLFQYFGHLKTFILAVNPDADLTPANSFGSWTVNPDGTVTVNSEN